VGDGDGLGLEVPDLAAGFDPDLLTGIVPVISFSPRLILTGYDPALIGGALTLDSLFDGRGGNSDRKRRGRTGNPIEGRIQKIRDHIIDFQIMSRAARRDKVRVLPRRPMERVPFLHASLTNRQNRWRTFKQEWHNVLFEGSYLHEDPLFDDHSTVGSAQLDHALSGSRKSGTPVGHIMSPDQVECRPGVYKPSLGPALHH